MGDGELHAVLIEEATKCELRLRDWLEDAPFGRPTAESRPDPTFKTRPLYYVELITGHFLVRTDWNARAIVCLCGGGMAVQAQPILRAAIESAIDLRYVSTSPQTLVTKWTLHEETLHYGAWKDRPEDERPVGFGHAATEVDRRLRQLNRHCPKRNGKQWVFRDLAHDWDLSSVSSRDKAACRLLDDNNAQLFGAYQLLCGSLHGDTQAAQDFVVALGEGKFAMVEGLPRRKQVFVCFFTLLALDVCLKAAVRCGARIPDSVRPQWDSLGIDQEQLIEAAAADFAVQPAQLPASR
jgi:hypothetical protein